jgi:hypothetical protein
MLWIIKYHHDRRQSEQESLVRVVLPVGGLVWMEDGYSKLRKHLGWPVAVRRTDRRVCLGLAVRF